LARERRIGLRRGLHERERVVDRDLGVVRKIAIQACEGVGPGLQPSGIGDRVRAAVQRAKRGKESALARRRRAHGDRALGKAGAAAQRLTLPRIATGSTDKGIAPGVERQPPVAPREARIPSAMRPAPIAEFLGFEMIALKTTYAAARTKIITVTGYAGTRNPVTGLWSRFR